MRTTMAAGLSVLTVLGAAPSRADPVVVELFTSQGCSSCPPADAVLRDLARTRPDVLALGFHVDYWDRLGWRDPFSLADATARQRHYVSALGLETGYTPQMVVDGRQDLIGSDRPAAMAAIARAESARPPATPLAMERAGGSIAVRVGAGAGQARPATVYLVGYDPVQTTAIGRGENAGLRSTEANVVREILPVGSWRGAPATLTSRPPAGERVAALLQTDDGHVLAAARLDP